MPKKLGEGGMTEGQAYAKMKEKPHLYTKQEHELADKSAALRKSLSHRDEKGRISPAQSKVAQAMSGRKPLLPMNEHQRSMLGKTMGGMAKEQEEKHHYGKGLKRLEYMKKTSPNKIAKARVVLRGQKSDYRKAYTKGLTETTKRFKAKGMM